MPIISLLTPSRTLQAVEGGSKKRVLEMASKLIAESAGEEVTYELVFTGLIGRERLGSTGIGEGVAIPHCRLAGIDKPVGALIHLAEPIDFDAIDSRPVDLMFFLLVPEEASDEHLGTLAKLAEVFSQDECRVALRAADSDENLLATATRLFN
jgi:PTS system nitrogen regulatory IIA component